MQEINPEAAQGKSQSQYFTVETRRGPIHIRTHCPVPFVSTLGIDPGIGLFFHYRPSAPGEQHEVLRKIAGMVDGNVVLAYSSQRVIVGYIAMHPVSDVVRWGQGDTSGYYEFGAIEVSRNWRSLGLAKALVDAAFTEDWLEDRIVISHELSWHWDLTDTGLTKRQYRDLLYGLLSRAGFKEYPTDEGNIRMDPNNLFTARIGKRASPELRQRFMRSLFAGNGPDSWWWPGTR